MIFKRLKYAPAQDRVWILPCWLWPYACCHKGSHEDDTMAMSWADRRPCHSAAVPLEVLAAAESAAALAASRLGAPPASVAMLVSEAVHSAGAWSQGSVLAAPVEAGELASLECWWHHGVPEPGPEPLDADLPPCAVGECTQMLDIVQHVLMRIQDELEANPRMRLDSGLSGSLLSVCERLRCFRNGAEGHSVMEVAFPVAEGRRVPISVGVPTALLTPASVASVDTAVRAPDQNGESVFGLDADGAGEVPIGYTALQEEMLAEVERKLAARSALCAAVAASAIASPGSSVSRVEAIQLEAAELALSSLLRVRKCEFLQKASEEAEAAGVGDLELSAANELLSDEVQKLSAQSALLLAVRVPDIGAQDIRSLHAAVLQGEAAGLVDSELFSAKAMLALLVAQQRAVIARLSAECGMPAGWGGSLRGV